MNLTPHELENLQDFRFWEQWCAHNLPAGLADALGEAHVQQLINMLRCFQNDDGIDTNLFAGGAIILTSSIERHLFKQLQDLVAYNIRNARLVTCAHPRAGGATGSHFKLAYLTFSHGKGPVDTGFSNPAKAERTWRHLRRRDKSLTREEFAGMAGRLDRSFLDHEDEVLIARNMLLYRQSLDDINVKVEVQREAGQAGQHCIAVVVHRSARTGFLLNLLRVFYFFKYPIKEARTIYVPSDVRDETSLLHFYVDRKGGTQDADPGLARLLESLAMVPWFEFENPRNHHYVQGLGFSINHAILLRSMEEFIFQMLVSVDANMYAPEWIHEAFTRHPDIATALVAAFQARFSPLQYDMSAYTELRESALSQIRSFDSGIVANDERRRVILMLAVRFIDRCLKTNYHVAHRSSLSFRLDPAILDDVPFADRKAVYPDLPHGIFFIKGRNFIAFNIRFRDFARGGVRTLLPADEEHLQHQQKEIFKECYSLAQTQQKKNKDIPEGGAKSILFVKPYVGLQRELALERELLNKDPKTRPHLHQLLAERRALLLRNQYHDAQKSFCDSLLDLLVWDDKGDRLEKDNIRDHLGREELIYLGPDENMGDEMIEWICARAVARGYKVGPCFISGKKDGGINHKEYGVTSLGLHEYLREALRVLLHDPKTYTAKITGGPDGDVAGNEIMNIVKDHGQRCRILCIQDGTAIAHDPAGLDQGELARLFRQQQGMAHFNPALLHKGAFILLVREKRSDKPGVEEILRIDAGPKGPRQSWIKASAANGIYHHFLHQLPTDVFLPCGGRPRTLGDGSWRDFLGVDGKPTARVIVEGANLYLSDKARLELEKLGVGIIKDASGNKCGVICSSYEVLSNSLLGSERFMKMKKSIVRDILVILKDLARKEADLLLNQGGSNMVALSDRISEQINANTDLIMEQLPLMRRNAGHMKHLNRILVEHIPPSIRKVIGQSYKRMPKIYQDAIISSALASRLVYSRGLDFKPSIAEALVAEIKSGRI